MPLFLLQNWKAIAVALVVAASFIAGYRTNSAFEAKERERLNQEFQAALDEEQFRRNEISKDYEKKLAAERKKVKVVTRTIQVETEKPAYQCEIPKTGVDLINNTVKEFNDSRNLKTINSLAKTLNERRVNTPKDIK